MKFIDECQDEYTKEYFLKLISLLREIKVITENNTSQLKRKEIDSITIKLTNSCNLKCVHCVASCGGNQSNELTIKDVVEIIDWCNEQKVKAISLTGGEIFTKKDIIDIIQYIGKKFTGKLYIMTNGVLIDDKVTQNIKDYIHGVDISLDGYNETSVEKIRGKGVYKKVLNAIDCLHKCNIKEISLSMVLTKENKQHVEEFRKLCSSLNVKDMLRVLMPEGRAYDNYDDLCDEDVENIQMSKEELKEKQREYNFKATCASINEKIMINEKMEVYPCPLLEKAEYYKGNANELYLNQMKEIETKVVVDEIDSCKQCDIRYFCASNCVAMDQAIFLDNRLREIRCKKSKQLFNCVWE